MDQMHFIAVAPLVMLTVGALAVLVIDLTLPDRRDLWALTAAAALVLSFVSGLVQWDWAMESVRLHFARMVTVDGFAAFASILIPIVAAVGLAAAWDLVTTLERRGAEFVALLLLSAAGVQLMAAAANLVFLFLALEVASIALYVMAGFTRDQIESDEAALKYFLLGAFASAVFLYGVALFYAATGTLDVLEADNLLRTSILTRPGLLLASIGLMIVGLGFKVSAAPFHMWAPDVYQGAPSGAVGFMAAAAKIGGFAALGRVLAGAVDGYSVDWAPAVAVLAAASIVVGTFLALVQEDVKRMLAYSSVAHAGFMLTALVAGRDGLDAMWFYLATYAVQVVAAFAVTAVVSGAGGSRSNMDDYAGLAGRNAGLASILMVMMLGMGGIPLTTGFVGKVGVFQAAIDAGYLWLVVVGVVASVVALFFYLRIVVVMYMSPVSAVAPGAATAAPRPRPEAGVALWFTVAVTIVLGVIPWPLLNALSDALASTL